MEYQDKTEPASRARGHERWTAQVGDTLIVLHYHGPDNGFYPVGWTYNLLLGFPEGASFPRDIAKPPIAELPYADRASAAAAAEARLAGLEQVQE